MLPTPHDAEHAVQLLHAPQPPATFCAAVAVVGVAVAVAEMVAGATVAVAAVAVVVAIELVKSIRKCGTHWMLIAALIQLTNQSDVEVEERRVAIESRSGSSSLKEQNSRRTIPQGNVSRVKTPKSISFLVENESFDSEKIVTNL